MDTEKIIFQLQNTIVMNAFDVQSIMFYARFILFILFFLVKLIYFCEHFLNIFFVHGCIVRIYQYTGSQ